MTDSELNFSNKAIKRKKLFLPLSIIGVVTGFALAAFYIWHAVSNPDSNIGMHFVIVVLILLSARQNLRQHYYVQIIEKLLAKTSESNDAENELKNTGNPTLQDLETKQSF